MDLAQEAREDAPRGQGKPAGMSGQLRRILVADDDPTILTLVKAVLKSGPYEVVTCGDAESALVCLQTEPPFDVIISDFMLPGLSGLEFVSKLRLSERTSATPILMMSGHTNYAMEERALAAGANLFLHKPFTLSELRVAVKNLSEHSPHTAAS